MPRRRKHVLTKAEDWKPAMHAALDGRASRYAFVRDCEAEGICTVHTGECLLAGAGTVTGQRLPSLDVAIAMARRAGYDIVMTPRRGFPPRLPGKV